MLTFLDGPAGGQTLQIKRAPIMLRVVRGPRGKLDALDQLGDVAEQDESIHVYRQASTVHHVHICARGKGGKALSGWWPIGSYKLFQPTPFDIQVRDNDDWAKWCESVRESVAEQMRAEGLITGEVPA